MGGEFLIGWSFLLFRRELRRWDTALRGRHQRAQASPCALRDLAVLLRRPARAAAELAAACRSQLTGQDQPLVGRQTARKQTYATQFMAQHDQLLEICAQID